MTNDELIERLRHFSGLSYGNPICKEAADRIKDLIDDRNLYQAELKMIKEQMPRYDWKRITTLPDRLRAIASMMHAGAAWGFCGEAMFLEEAADLLENDTQK